MKISKSLAGVAAAALAATGLAVATAPAANAFNANLSLGCWVDGISTSIAAWPNTANANQSPTINHTLTVNGNDGSTTINVNTGASVPLSYSYSQGPINGGPPTPIGGAVAVATFQVFQGATQVGSDITSSTWTNTTAIGGGSTAAFPGATFTGTWTAPSAGTYQVKVKQVVFTSSGLNIYCNGNTAGPGNPFTSPVAYASTTTNVLGPNATVTAVGGQQAGVTAYARSTNTISVSGSLWGANVASGGFTATVGGAAATNTLTTDASGNISGGTITVPAGATTGLTTIALSQGTNSSSTPITILGNGTITLSPASGGPGALVTVSGSNFNPGATYYTFQYKANPFASSFAGSISALQCPATATTLATVGPFVPVDAVSGARSVPTALAASTDASGVAGTYAGLATTTSGSGTGLVVRVVRAAGTLLPTITVTGAGSGYAVNDTVTIAAGATGAGSNAITVAITNVGSLINTTGANTGQTCGTSTNVVASATGTLSTTFNVTTGMVGFFVAEGTSTYPAGITGSQSNGRSALTTFTVNADTCTRQVGTDPATLCETKQNISATVTAGALTQTASAFGPGYTSTSIPFGSIATSTTAGTLTANLNPITVADARGGSSGWSLTAAMPALTEVGGGSIANSNLSTTSVSCAANATGSATGNVAGAASQTFAGTVTLCQKNTNADSAGGTSGGQYIIGAGLSLNVPAFQKTGAYTSTITVTLT